MKAVGHVAVWGLLVALLAAQVTVFAGRSSLILTLAALQVILMVVFYWRLPFEARGVWMVMVFGLLTIIALIAGLLAT